MEVRVLWGRWEGIRLCSNVTTKHFQGLRHHLGGLCCAREERIYRLPPTSNESTGGLPASFLLPVPPISL